VGRPRKNVSIYNIAKAADVSIATVSRVLNNRHEVSPEARARVQQTLQEFQFKPSANGQRKGSIGIVVPEWPGCISLSLYDTRIIEGIASHALSNDMDCTLIFHVNEQGGLADTIRKRSCLAAVLLRPFELAESELVELAKSGMSIVLANLRTDFPELGYIDCDSFEAGQKLGAYIAGLGHRRVAFLQDLPEAPNHRSREDGFFEAFEKHGGRREQCEIIQTIASRDSASCGFLQAEKALSEHPDLTAIVSTNDEMAYGVLQSCAKRGLRVPEDISVAGFDNYPLSAHSVPPLTTVEQPLFEIGKMAAEAAAMCIKSGPIKPIRAILPVELVVRASTGPRKGLS